MASTSRNKPVSSEEDNLVKGRTKRSTAGNRMRALLDSELEADTGFEEVEDDVDFVAKEEEDAFDNDFASTDEEEGADDAEDAGERTLRREEKQARKFSRANPTRDPSMAYLKPRAQPKALISSLDRSAPSPPPAPRKSRISFAETDTVVEGSEIVRSRSKSATVGADGEEGGDDAGETVEGDAPDGEGEPGEDGESRRRRRASGRKATIASKAEVDARIAAEEAERMKAPHRYKQPVKKARYTQDELIEEALFTEEMNNESLQDWLEKEEARRLALKVVRKKIEGPTVSWISRDSSRSMVVEIGADGEEELDKGKGREVALAEEDSSLAASTPPANAVAGPSRVSARISGEAAPPIDSSPTMPSDERHTRNYVLLEPAPANWSKELRVLFGNHTNWSKLKIVPARNRPQTRRPTMCPITGLPAQYLDPRSGVPYANLAAYKTLTSLLEQQWNWSAELGAYVGGGGVQPADGVPEGWDGNEQDEMDLEDAIVRKRAARIREEKEKAVAAAAAAAALAEAAMVVEEEMLIVEPLPEEVMKGAPVVAPSPPPAAAMAPPSAPPKRKRPSAGGGGFGHGGKRVRKSLVAAEAVDPSA